MASAGPPHLAPAYRPDIDGLRAIAVGAVVLHHAFPQAFPSGFVGVDIFFVISGYLISSIIIGQLQAGRFSFRDFYARRIRRIFPALLLVLVACLGTGWLMMTAAEFKALGRHVLAGTLFVSNFGFWQEANYFDESAIYKPLLHLWSLAIEEQFYIAWPLLLLVAYRWRALPWLIAGLLLASLVLNLWLVRTDTTAAFYNPAARFWEMMMGAGLAALQLRSGHPGAAWPRWLVHITSAAGLALLAFVFWRLTPAHAFPGKWALAATLGTTLLIAAGPQAWPNRILLAWRPMVWLGLISYPLYLWHWPLLSLAHIEVGRDLPTPLLLGLVGLSVVLATATYLGLERPIRRHGHRLGRPLVGVLTALMVAVAAAGGWVYQQSLKVDTLPALLTTLQTKGGRSAVAEGWRDGDCMLDYNLPPSAYKAHCVEERRPLIFLWGDSHAGSLYPGFKALQDSGRYSFGLGERTGAICPPILGHDPRPGCQALNDDTIALIRRTVPDVVVLYAWWHEKAVYGRYDISGLEATVAELRKAGVPRIVLLGAVPYWKENLPRILLRLSRQLDRRGRLPLRLGDDHLDPHVKQATAEMRQRAAAMGIEFISGMDYFCNAEGCLTRLDENATEPLSYDYGHLSVPAVTYYVEQIAPQILGQR